MCVLIGLVSHVLLMKHLCVCVCVYRQQDLFHVLTAYSMYNRVSQYNICSILKITDSLT